MAEMDGIGQWGCKIGHRDEHKADGDGDETELRRRGHFEPFSRSLARPLLMMKTIKADGRIKNDSSSGSERKWKEIREIT